MPDFQRITAHWSIPSYTAWQQRHNVCIGYYWDALDSMAVRPEFQPVTCWGYWYQRADERHGNPLPTLPWAISRQRQSWKTPGELGVSKSMECDIFPSVLWHCWLGDRKGIRPVKRNWMLVCWWWWFDWSFAQFTAPVVSATSIILCFNEHRLTQVHLEMAIKWKEKWILTATPRALNVGGVWKIAILNWHITETVEWVSVSRV